MSHVQAKEQSVGAADLREALRAGGFRVTGGRVALLELLFGARKPLSIQGVLERWKGTPPDQATLYRTLTDLAAAGIVRRVDLNTGTAHFEYTPDRPHHHHIVCDGCGVIEDVESCAVGALQQELAKSSQFASIYSHNLEFFGRCTGCAK